MPEGPAPVEQGTTSQEAPPVVPKFINEIGKTARFQADLAGKNDDKWQFGVRDTHSADGTYPKGRFLHDPKTEKSLSFDSVDEALALAAEKNGPGSLLEEPSFEELKHS